MSSNRLLQVPRKGSLVGDRLGTFPNGFLKREDLLATTVIKSPNPKSSPSPPTSGLTDLIGDVDVMFSRTSHSSTRRGTQDLEEVTLKDLGRYFPRWRQGAEISDSKYGSKEDDDDEDEDATVQPGPSKYNVKPPPARSSTQVGLMVTPTRSTPGTTRESPRTHSTVQTTPEEGASAEEDNLDEKSSGEDAKVPEVAERSLRKRTLQQTNPYKFEKHRYQLSRKTGHAADANKVERAVKEEIGRTQKQSTTKKPRGLSGKSARASTPRSQTAHKRHQSSSVCSVPPSPDIDYVNTFDPTRTTLRVRLDGFPGGAATRITLSECKDNDELIDFILKSWEWKFRGAGFSHAVVSFPWLTQQSNILLRQGLPESFQGMVSEIENAPIWEEEAHARCDIEITVYLQ